MTDSTDLLYRQGRFRIVRWRAPGMDGEQENPQSRFAVLDGDLRVHDALSLESARAWLDDHFNLDERRAHAARPGRRGRARTTPARR